LTVIVPLAGPDFELEQGYTKAERHIDGVPLLIRCLHSRPWFQADDDGSDYVFVLQDTTVSRDFAISKLAKWFPSSKVVYLSAFSDGAALSALAGVALCELSKPLIIDLADIEFSVDSFSIKEIFDREDRIGAVALTFDSSSSLYSYIRESAGRFIEALEKTVISEHASTGVYIYRNPLVFLDAFQRTVGGGRDYRHNGLHYVCPVFNGVKAMGLEVHRMSCVLIRDVKIG
jgi:hypothetical protein